jgi:hypothetical protein
MCQGVNKVVVVVVVGDHNHLHRLRRNKSGEGLAIHQPRTTTISFQVLTSNAARFGKIDNPSAAAERNSNDDDIVDLFRVVRVLENSRTIIFQRRIRRRMRRSERRRKQDQVCCEQEQEEEK